MTLLSLVNLVSNPRPRYSTTGWGTASATLSTQVVGSRSWFKATWATAGSGVGQVTCTVTGLTVGKTYVLHGIGTVSSGPNVRFFVSGVGSGTAWSAATDATRATYQVVFTATATSHTVGVQTAGASTSGQVALFDSVMVELGSTAHPYFDGDLPGASWSAAPYLSSSSMAYDDNPRWPQVIVEFDARPAGAGDFILDSSSLDGPDILSDLRRWTEVEVGNVTVTEVAIRRGRQNDQQPVQPGSMTVIFEDPDGLWDPDNPTTPYSANGQPIMRSNMAVRASLLIVVANVLTYVPLFMGFLDDAQIDRTYLPICTITAYDALSAVNNADVPPIDPPFGEEGLPSSGHAAWLMAYAGLGMDDYAVSSYISPGRLMLGRGGGGNVGSGMNELANAEGGRFFADASGILQLTSHGDDFALSAAVVFTDQPSASTDIDYETISSSSSIKSLINRARVDRGNEADSVSAQDDDSVALNGVKSETVTAPLADYSDALALATWRATRRSQATTRFDSVTSNLTGQPQWWPNMAALELGSNARVARTAAGRTVDLQLAVEGVDHDFTLAGWTATTYFSLLDTTGLYAGQGHVFFLDSSSLDGPDVLSAY